MRKGRAGGWGKKQVWRGRTWEQDEQEGRGGRAAVASLLWAALLTFRKQILTFSWAADFTVSVPSLASGDSDVQAWKCPWKCRAALKPSRAGGAQVPRLARLLSPRKSSGLLHGTLPKRPLAKLSLWVIRHETHSSDFSECCQSPQSKQKVPLTNQKQTFQVHTQAQAESPSGPVTNFYFG